MTAAREKIIEAMARAFCDEVGEPDEIVTVYTYEHGEHQSIGKPRWETMVPRAEDALTAIAEQGYAVVPREATFPLLAGVFNVTEFYNGAIADADIARPDPAGEAKP